MRKLSVFNLVTLEGFFEGPNHDISWHRVDSEFNDFAGDLTGSSDTLLFGRVTYQLMERYWPTPDAQKTDPVMAGLMNHTPKVVFSRTLQAVTWENSTLHHGDLVKEIKQLKQLSGKNITILGSGTIVSALAPLGLIDEYQFLLNPIILGEGTPMFNGIKNRINFKLVQSRAFHSGNVLLVYQPG